jgi:hypothetical protein
MRIICILETHIYVINSQHSKFDSFRIKIDRLRAKYWCFGKTFINFSICCCGPTLGRAKLKAQLEVVRELHDKDLAAGYAGVFLPDSLERKYPAAAKDFIWQWFFPQKGLTLIPGTKEYRRYHLHESKV